MDCLRGCLATLSVLVVRIALLEYSKINEKAYKFIVCEFGGFQNVLRDASVRAIPTYRESTDSLIIISKGVYNYYTHCGCVCIMYTCKYKSFRVYIWDGKLVKNYDNFHVFCHHEDRWCGWHGEFI